MNTFFAENKAILTLLRGNKQNAGRRSSPPGIKEDLYVLIDEYSYAICKTSRKAFYVFISQSVP